MSEESYYLEPPRARRRRVKESAYRRAVKYIVQGYYFPINEEDVINQAQRRADNFQICSCHACGNQRHNPWLPADERLSIQERKAWTDMKQQYEELYIKLPKKRTGRFNGR